MADAESITGGVSKANEGGEWNKHGSWLIFGVLYHGEGVDGIPCKRV